MDTEDTPDEEGKSSTHKVVGGLCPAPTPLSLQLLQGCRAHRSLAQRLGLSRDSHAVSRRGGLCIQTRCAGCQWESEHSPFKMCQTILMELPLMFRI